MLLGTRFAPSAPTRATVSRERLLSILRKSDDAGLTIIHGPAGFGKTTLAVQWYRELRKSGEDAAWLSIIGDESPESFLAHLFASVQRVTSQVVGDLADLLEQQGPGAEKAVTNAFINAVTTRGRTLTVVIDDGHRLEREETLDLVSYLIENGGQHLRVVVTTRVRTALPLSRARLYGRLCEINGSDLRFDIEESRLLLGDIGGIALPDGTVASLTEATDGWAAALQLAALSLSEQGSASAIGDIPSDMRKLAGFLADDVVAGLDAELLDFLLATSLPARICGDLAEALTGRPDSADLLADIERRNLFLEHIDETQHWLRYHHLFAEFLRQRLETAMPERVSALHEAATTWFAEQGMIADALEHALAGGRPAVAADLVEDEVMMLIEDRRMTAVLELSGRLPVGSVAERPRLLLAVAWANCLLQRLTPAQQALDQLRYTFAIDRTVEGREAESRAALGCEIDVVQACIDVFADRIDRADALVAHAIADHDHQRSFVVSVAANIRSVVLMRNAEFDAAQQLQTWARVFHDRTTGQFPGVYGRCLAGVAAAAELDLSSAETLVREALALARDSAGAVSHAAKLAAALLAEFEYERGRIDSAEALALDSRRSGTEGGLVEFMIASYTTLANVRALRGDEEEAEALLAEGTGLAERLTLPRLAARTLFKRVKRAVHAGGIATARALAQSIPDGSGQSGGVAAEIDALRIRTDALIASADGHHHAAIGQLDRLLAQTSQERRIRDEVNVRIQLADAQERAGRSDQAAQTLTPALQVGARAGLQRTFLDAGGRVLAVIERVAQSTGSGTGSVGETVNSDYIKDLLKLSGSAFVHADLSPHLRSLSAREIEILSLVSQGMRNQEMAEELDVTVNTVKWHLKNINSKLGVSNRMESVNVVRRAGLLH